MKKVITGLLVLLCISALTGCGKDDVTLTNEDNDLVAEYIAGTLLKYSYDNEWKYQKLNSAQNGEGTFKDAPFETFGDSLDKFELPDAQTDELKKTGQKKKASNVIKAGCGVFRLESLNDFEEMCTVSSRTWGITNALYKNKEDDTYYLVLEKGRCSEEKYRSLLNLLMEYSVFDSSKEERVAFIREHYSVVIGSNAINVVKKYM